MTPTDIRIEIKPRRFAFELTEMEVCDLVIALRSYRVSPNYAHALRTALTKALGYEPKDTPDI